MEGRKKKIKEKIIKRPEMFVHVDGWEHAGAHHPEGATYLFSCNGVFTSKVIFRLNFPLMRLPQEPDDQLQEIKLTS